MGLPVSITTSCFHLLMLILYSDISLYVALQVVTCRSFPQGPVGLPGEAGEPGRAGDVGPRVSAHTDTST